MDIKEPSGGRMRCGRWEPFPEAGPDELSRDLLLGKITQAQFNARCAELKNPEWFARYHPDRSIQQQPQVSKLPAHMKAIRK